MISLLVVLMSFCTREEKGKGSE